MTDADRLALDPFGLFALKPVEVERRLDAALENPEQLNPLYLAALVIEHQVNLDLADSSDWRL